MTTETPVTNEMLAERLDKIIDILNVMSVKKQTTKDQKVEIVWNKLRTEGHICPKGRMFDTKKVEDVLKVGKPTAKRIMEAVAKTKIGVVFVQRDGKGCANTNKLIYNLQAGSDQRVVEVIKKIKEIYYSLKKQAEKDGRASITLDHLIDECSKVIEENPDVIEQIIKTNFKREIDSMAALRMEKDPPLIEF